MDSATDTMYADRMRAIMRSATNLCHGVRVYPYSPDGKRVERNAVRPVPLQQWLLDPEDAVVKVVGAYTTMRPGTVKQLMTGTGVGKSTVVPVEIAGRHETNVIVLEPNLTIAMHVGAYVQRCVATRQSRTVAVSVLTGDVPRRTAGGGSVVYADIGTFLGHYSAHPEMLKTSGVQCIIVDESHESTPPYYVIPYMIALGMLNDCVVFYSSATAATDVSMEREGANSVVTLPECDLLAEPNDNHAESPVHYTQITGKEVFFLADDTEIAAWSRYLSDHDIPSHAHGYCCGTRNFTDACGFMGGPAPRVLLTTGVLQTGVTIDVDKAVCFGYTTRCITDFERGVVRLERRPVTRSDQIQRAGRAGRVRKGSAYVADVRTSPRPTVPDVDTCCYMFLWFRVLGVTVRDQAIAAFGDAFGTLQPATVAAILSMPFPPLLMLPYFADDGIYSGFAGGVQSLALCHTKLPVSHENNDDKVERWEEYDVVDESIPGGVGVFRCAVEPPKQWYLAFYHLWTSYLGSSDSISVSGLTTFEVAKPRAMGMVFGRKNAVVPSAVYTMSRTSVATTRDVYPVRPSTAGSDASTVRAPGKRVVSPPPLYSSRADLQKIPALASADKECAKWVESVETPQDVASSSSAEIDESELTVVNPKKYYAEQLYPMDGAIRSKYMRGQKPNGIDHARYSRLLRGSVSFLNLGAVDGVDLKERQIEYYLSVLRVHNNAVVLWLQAKAATIMKRVWIGRDPQNRIEQSQETAQVSAGLLIIAEQFGIYTAIRKHARHASTTGGFTQCSGHERLLSEAQYALNCGPRTVLGVVDVLTQCSAPVQSADGKYIAQGWVLNGCMYTTTHAVESETTVSTWACDAIGPAVISGERYAIPIEATDFPDVYVRQPVTGERAYVAVFDQAIGTVSLLGYRQVFEYGPVWLMPIKLGAGYSGGLVVAASDGALLGMYCGKYQVVNPITYSDFVLLC